MRKRFYFKEHLTKGRAYVEALERRDYVRTGNLKKADFIFADHDISWARQKHSPLVVFSNKHDIPFFIYPHAANSVYLWDVNQPSKDTMALFTQAPGNRRILKRLRYPCPIEVTGWTYTEIKSFESVKPNGKINVLFGPIHPMEGTGWLPEIERNLNMEVYKLLLDIPNINLTVRYIRTLEENKIWKNPNVKFINGRADGTTKEIEEADVVVGAYTFAYLSIALGKPTLMFGQSVPPHSGSATSNLMWGSKWDKWRDYIRYPFGIDRKDTLDNPSSAMDMMVEAMRGSIHVENWRKMFIGKPFDPDYFVDRVERYL